MSLQGIILGRAKALAFDVADYAPSTFEDTVAHFNVTGRFKVWSGGSERTIYGAPAVNWAFRAWHDSGHVALLAGFDLAGETRVCEWQAAQIPEPYRATIRAEVIGQAQYFAEHGKFPADQLAFVTKYLGRVA